jgi:tetratricopeptide (TPR) repeat protein
MLLPRQALPLLLVLAAASPAAAQGVGPLNPLNQLNPLNPLDTAPDHLKRYSECMTLARSEPLKALPVAEKWHGEGGGLAARHCVAVAMFEAGRYLPAAAQFEAIARDMGSDRPGLRAELWGQAGQAFIEAGAADKAAEAQSRAIELKGNDPDLWVDRGLSYAAMRAWPRAISDFDRALILRPAAPGSRRCGARAQDRAGSFRGAARARICQPRAGRAQPGQQRFQQGAAPRAAGLGRGAARPSRPARRAAGPAAGRDGAAGASHPEGRRQAVASVPSLM